MNHTKDDTAVPLPFLAYDFPCSYLGNPLPIQSALSVAPKVAPMGAIRHISQQNGTESLMSCPRQTSDGIASSTILESDKTVANLQSQYLQASKHLSSSPALAVELWFTPSKQVQTNLLLPIVSIAAPLSTHTNGRSGYHRTDPCDGVQFMLGQGGKFLELRYRDYYEYLPDAFFENDDDFEKVSSLRQYSCRVLRLDQWDIYDDDNDMGDALKGLHHIVISWKESGSVLQVFGNGKTIINIDLLKGDDILANSNPNFLRLWDPSFTLQCFSASAQWLQTDATRVFPGAIHRVAMYPHDLDEAEIKSIYNDGLKLREDPFDVFFGNQNNPFEPLRLEASLIAEEYDPYQGVAITQGGSAMINIGASSNSNKTTALWDVLVEIMDIPKYGNLVYPKASEISLEEAVPHMAAEVGDLFLLQEGNLQTKLKYQHTREEYFSIPKHSFSGNRLPMADLPGESFSYRLIATKKKTRNKLDNSAPIIIGESEIVRQNLTIVHKNHPPVLIGLPSEVWQPEWQPSRIGSRPWATLGNNITLDDQEDYDINQVQLDLWTYEGTLTIELDDKEIQDIADITSCSNPKPIDLGREWICNGKNDRNMTILATPKNMSIVLSNLKYKALHWDKRDTIVLKIRDGIGGQCLGNHSLQTIELDECFTISASVEVPPLSRQDGDPTRNIWWDHRWWWVSVSVFLIFGLISCYCSIIRWRQHRLHKDVVVEGNENPVELGVPRDDIESSMNIAIKDKKATNYA